jgi:hypothetical protein
VAGLHQVTELSTHNVDETWVPIDASTGLEPKVIPRPISCITMTLTTDVTMINTKSIGYQPPLDPSLVEPEPARAAHAKGDDWSDEDEEDDDDDDDDDDNMQDVAGAGGTGGRRSSKGAR